MPTRRPLSDRSGPIALPRSTMLVATRLDLGALNAMRGDLVGVIETKTFYEFADTGDAWIELQDIPVGYVVNWDTGSLIYDYDASTSAAPQQKTTRLNLGDLMGGRSNKTNRPLQSKPAEPVKETPFKLPILGDRKIDIGE